MDIQRKCYYHSHFDGSGKNMIGGTIWNSLEEEAIHRFNFNNIGGFYRKNKNKPFFL